MATGILIEYSTPTQPPPTSYYTPKVEKRKSFTQHHLTWPVKGLSAPVADMASVNFETLQRHAIPPVAEDSGESQESPSRLLAREMSPMSVDTPTTTNQSEWKPKGSESKLTMKKYSKKLSFSMSTQIIDHD